MPGIFSTTGAVPATTGTNLLTDIGDALPTVRRAVPFVIAWDRMGRFERYATAAGVLTGPSLIGASIAMAVGRTPAVRRKTLGLGLLIAAGTSWLVWRALKRANVLHLV